jgi:hypothetical protein
VDLFTYKPSTKSVQYTIKPTAGVAIAKRCAFVILGGRKPFVVDVIFRIALDISVVVFIKTFALLFNLNPAT